MTVDLDQVVVDPAGRQLSLTTEDRLAASPAGKLRVEADGPSRLTVTGLADYVGPAAIAFELTTAPTPQSTGTRASSPCRCRSGRRRRCSGARRPPSTSSWAAPRGR